MKTTYTLTSLEKEVFKLGGILHPPESIVLEAEEVAAAVKRFTRSTAKDISQEMLHAKALLNVYWPIHRDQQTRPEPPVPPVAHRLTQRAEGLLFAIAVLLVLLVAFSVQSHCQVLIQLQQDGSNIGTSCAGGPCKIDFSGCTVAKPGPGQHWTITCTSGTVTNNPDGLNNDLQIKNGVNFGHISDPGVAGKVLISQPSGPAAFADPQVQGMAADGASTTQNPVIGGGYDTAGTPLIHRFTMASTSPGGSDWGLVTRIAGTVPVSGTFWQATQPVSIASMPSTPVTNAALSNLQFDASNFLKVILQNTSVAVTGTFWQATQPVSGTFWQATQPVSGTTTANQGTAGSANWLFKIMDAAGNARGANVNASNQLSVSCDNGCAGGSSTPADTFSNPTTAGLQQTFPMLWNGTTWDRFYGDKTNGAFVNIKSSISIPVTGTFWQSVQPVSQSGTWTTGNFPTTVDTNSGNKSASTIRFVLATDQPNLTTALNVNCTSGCTAGGSFADSSAFTFGTTAVGNMSAVVDDVATNTVAENSAGAVRMNTNRILYVDLSKTAANATAVKVDNSAVTQPVSGTVAESNFPTTVDTNSGNKSASTIRVVLATDQPALTNKLLVTPDSVALPANQSVNISQINAVTPLMGNGVTGTGSPRVTIASDNTPFAVKIDQTTPGTTNAVQAVPGTSGGASTSYLPSAASTNATSVKASAGQVYTISAINTTATLYYLRMYNLAAAPTCSSATGFLETIPIPASTTGGGLVRDVSVGQAYSTGIAFCLTGGGSSTDNTSAATGVYLTILYK